MQGDDMSKMLSQAHGDGVQVAERVLRRIVRTEQLFYVGSPRVHRGKEQLVLAAEALIKNRFRDSSGASDLPRRCRMPVLAENVPRDAEHFVITNCLRARHAP